MTSLLSIRPVRRFICSSCLRKVRLNNTARRHLSTEQTDLLDSIVKTPGHAHLPTRRLISVTGLDGAKFLQGLTTSFPAPKPDLSPGFFSAFLNASGRVLHDVFIYTPPADFAEHAFASSTSAEQRYLIEVDANEAKSLVQHLTRYKLRAKVAIRLLEAAELTVWSSWGSSHRRLASDILVLEDRRVPYTETPRLANAESAERAQSQRPDCTDQTVKPTKYSSTTMGSRLLLPGNLAHPSVESERVGVEGYATRRAVLGVPEGQTEIIKATALPLESNLDYMGGIDFRKGCYVGQELTIRTHHTGVVRKRILPVVFPVQEDQPPQGTDMTSADGTKGRTVGKVLSRIGNVGLALCRLGLLDATAHTVSGQFRADWSEHGQTRTCTLEAYVPAWHHVRAEEQLIRRSPG